MNHSPDETVQENPAAMSDEDEEINVTSEEEPQSCEEAEEASLTRSEEPTLAFSISRLLGRTEDKGVIRVPAQRPQPQPQPFPWLVHPAVLVHNPAAAAAAAAAFANNVLKDRLSGNPL